MGLPQLKHPGYTLEDWMTWEGRWELIEGLAYDMTPAPSLEHQNISSNLHINLGNALAEARRKAGSGDCQVFAAPTDVYLDLGVVQPDLLVVCDPKKKSKRGIEGAPDLVVEILSPATAQKDWTHKRWAYEAAGVPEYLLVDPDERVGVLLRLNAGHYEEAVRVVWGEVVALLGEKLSIQLS